MSTNAIKLLNIQYVNNLECWLDAPCKDYFREMTLRHIAAKLIGEGC